MQTLQDPNILSYFTRRIIGKGLICIELVHFMWRDEKKDQLIKYNIGWPCWTIVYTLVLHPSISVAIYRGQIGITPSHLLYGMWFSAMFQFQISRGMVEALNLRILRVLHQYATVCKNRIISVSVNVYFMYITTWMPYINFWLILLYTNLFLFLLHPLSSLTQKNPLRYTSLHKNNLKCEFSFYNSQLDTILCGC